MSDKRLPKTQLMTSTSVRILASGLVSLIAAIMAGLALADPLIFAAWLVGPAIIVSLVALALTGYWFFKQSLTKASILAVILAGLAIPTLMGAAYSTMNASDVIVDDTTVIAPAPDQEKPNAGAPSSLSFTPEPAPAVNLDSPQATAAPPEAQSTAAPLTPEQAAAAESGAGATNDNQAQDEVPDTTELPDFNEPDLPAATFDDEATS